MGLTWTVNENHDIAFFQMNLYSNDLLRFTWELQYDKINALNISFNCKKVLKNRLRQVLALIPTKDPFVTL
jgi:hypothetical protein